MGISQIGVSSTTVDTTKKPKLTYNTRYSWSTTGGTTGRGYMVYRATDNTLYKMDNYANTSTGAFAKFNLSTNTASNLADLYPTHNPIDVPGLIVHPDGHIYCAPYRNSNNTYTVSYPRYNVSANTWAFLSGVGHTYGFNICNTPKVPSWFSNSTDTVFFGGALTSVSSQFIINATALTRVAASIYDVDAGLNGVSANRYIEIKKGAEDLYPSGYYVVPTPESTTSWVANPSLFKASWETTDVRTANAFRMAGGLLPGFERNASYGDYRYVVMGGGQVPDPVCLESRWILYIGTRGGANVVNIDNGDQTIVAGVEHVPTNGITNPVYVSSTKKLYFHGTDQYLYEYDVTFG